MLAEEEGFTYWLNKNQRDEIWINAEEKREDRGQKPEDRGQHADPENQPPAPGKVKSLPPENILTAVRLLMQPKKRGEGVTAQVAELAAKLEKSADQLLALLATAGLQLPESPKAKPTFAEHGGEIYWLNANAKGQVWLNAKQSATAKKSRAKRSDE